LVFAWFRLTFPSTASASQVSIGGLPATAANNANFAMGSGVGAAGICSALITHNTKTSVFYTAAGGSLTNVSQSLAVLTAMLQYSTA